MAFKYYMDQIDENYRLYNLKFCPQQRKFFFGQKGQQRGFVAKNHLFKEGDSKLGRNDAVWGTRNYSPPGLASMPNGKYWFPFCMPMHMIFSNALNGSMCVNDELPGVFLSCFSTIAFLVRLPSVN